MNTPEIPESRSVLDDLCNRLDEETIHMSGGFQDLDEFQQVVDKGVSALPVLLADREEPRWWRMQAVWTIARDTGEPIEFPDEIKGQYPHVRDITIDWAVTRGYITEEPEAE